MAESFIQTPDDSTNTGKKVRTITRVVGPDTVHEHFMILQDYSSNIQAGITTSAPASNATGLIVWPVITPITGTVSVSGNVGVSPISGVVSVSGNVGVSPISGVVSVSGAVSANITGTVSVSGTVTVQGSAADGATASGNPVQGGLIARTTNRTAVSDGQAVRSAGDDLGRQVIILNQVRDLITQNNATLTSTTETQILAAGAAGVFHDLTYLKFTNESQVSTRIDVRAATGGTIRWTCNLVPGGTTNDLFLVPFLQASAATDWTAKLSVTATVYVTIQAAKNV